MGRMAADCDDDNSGGMATISDCRMSRPGCISVTGRGDRHELRRGTYTLVSNFVEGHWLGRPPSGGVGRSGILRGWRNTAGLERDCADSGHSVRGRGLLLRSMRRVTWRIPPEWSQKRHWAHLGLGVCGQQCPDPHFCPRILNSTAGCRVWHEPRRYGRFVCDHNLPDTGFGMTYNFNHLPRGHIRSEPMRTVSLESDWPYAETFEVVHLMDFAAIDDDRFLRGLAGECRVKDFPDLQSKRH